MTYGKTIESKIKAEIYIVHFWSCIGVEAERREAGISWLIGRSGRMEEEEIYKFLLLVDHGYLGALLDGLVVMRDRYRGLFGLDPSPKF